MSKYSVRIFLCLPLLLQMSTTTPGAPSTVQRLLSMNVAGSSYGPSQVQISPDGKWIVYQMRQTVLAQNQYIFDLWLIDASGKGQPRQVTHNKPTTSWAWTSMPRWSPDSKTLAYFSNRGGAMEIWVMALDEFKEEPLIQTQQVSDRHSTTHPLDLKWSPDGKSIAFIAGVGNMDEGNLTKGVEVDPNWEPQLAAPNLGLGLSYSGWKILNIIDVNSHKVTRLTDPPLNVLSLNWAPDGRRIVFSGSEGVGPDGFMKTDVYTADLATRKISTLIKQDGMDQDPVCSPDGKWVAFSSQKGVEDWLYGSVLALVPAAGGKPVYLTDSFFERAGSSFNSLDMTWSADSKFIYSDVRLRLSSQLFRVPVNGGEVVKITTDDSRYYTGFSYTADGGQIAFTSQSPTEPADVYVSSLSSFAPSKVTNVNPEQTRAAGPGFEVLSVRSQDDKFDIQSILIKPPNYQAGRKYPLVVFVQGGPSMVTLSYNIDSQYPLMVFANGGYLVLATNTRGRGGFGRAFRNESAMGPNAVSDLLVSVDSLVQRGIADPSRLGIMGFSYGGYLTPYAITQTNRFKAASASEGIADMVYSAFVRGSASALGRGFRERFGVAPYNEKDTNTMMQHSALYNIQKVKTPLLVEYGVNSLALEQGRVLFQGLRYFNIPSEFIIYPRTGHGVSEPRLLEDSMSRNLTWFDYWLLGKAYPDASKQAQYDRWKQEQVGNSQRRD